MPPDPTLRPAGPSLSHRSFTRADMPSKRMGTTVWSRYARIGSDCTFRRSCSVSAAFSADDSTCSTATVPNTQSVKNYTHNNRGDAAPPIFRTAFLNCLMSRPFQRSFCCRRDPNSSRARYSNLILYERSASELDKRLSPSLIEA